MPKTIELSVIYFGTQVVVRPYAVQGLGLLCSGPIRSIMVLSHQCGDQQAFWDAWRELGGEAQGLELEGGVAFKAPIGVSISPAPGPPDGGAMAGWLPEASFLRWIARWLKTACGAFWRLISRAWELPAEDSPKGGA